MVLRIELGFKSLSCKLSFQFSNLALETLLPDEGRVLL